MLLSGAQILIKFLEEQGVDTIWGYPGGAVLPIYDVLDSKDTKILHILVRHEQAATHAADGYARATNKPGVVLVTSGPGATNAVTGIATAYMDSIPMIVITGQVPTAMIGLDSFQEVDTIGITRPIVKHNFLVSNVEDLAVILMKAFYIATTGRPGPVVIDIPKDIQNAKCEYTHPHSVSLRTYNPSFKGHVGQINKAIDLMTKSKKPIIYVGGGVVIGDASKELIEFVETTGFPITKTLMALGAFPGSNELSLGMLGMHGTYEANMAMHESDLVIAIGARFDDRVTGNIDTFCPKAKFIHIDIDPSSISKNVMADVPIVGDVKNILKKINEQIKTISLKKLDQKDWWQEIDKWRMVKSLQYDNKENLLKPQAVVECLYEITNGNAYITSDVGQHQMFVAQYYIFNKPNKWINSGGLGTMGFGLPAAMGVKSAFPNENVVCVTGEGSIVMNIQELSTCMQYNFPIKIVCLNNGFLGMVRQWQEMFYGKRYSMSYIDSLPDFTKLAESYGHVGIKIDKYSDLKPKLSEAMNIKDRLVFIDVHTTKEENVYPMIPSGGSHGDMILEPGKSKK